MQEDSPNIKTIIANYANTTTKGTSTYIRPEREQTISFMPSKNLTPAELIKASSLKIPSLEKTINNSSSRQIG